jgi:hypothetical protein
MIRWSTRLAWVATGLAALAAAAGLLAGVYRDVPAMVEQAQAADLATLFIAVPLLAFALVRRQRLIAVAGVAYLAYTYAIFSFEVVLNPMSLVYIATLSLSAWALVLGVPALRPSADQAWRLPRRTTAGFLALVALLFAGLWLSDIAGSITSGVLPPSVTALDVPTSAVYVLDLGFVLPLFVLASVLLVRRSIYGAPLAFGSLVFLVLMALSILPMFGMQVARGDMAEPVGAVIFITIAVVAGILVAASSIPDHPVARRQGTPAVAR